MSFCHVVGLIVISSSFLALSLPKHRERTRYILAFALILKMKFSQAIALAILSFSMQVQAASWIVPGAVWKDTTGATIDAHGGNVVKRGDTFYWVGQSASNGTFLVYFLLFSGFLDSAWCFGKYRGGGDVRDMRDVGDVGDVGGE